MNILCDLRLAASWVRLSSHASQHQDAENAERQKSIYSRSQDLLKRVLRTDIHVSVFIELLFFFSAPQRHDPRPVTSTPAKSQLAAQFSGSHYTPTTATRCMFCSYLGQISDVTRNSGHCICIFDWAGQAWIPRGAGPSWSVSPAQIGVQS